MQLTKVGIMGIFDRKRKSTAVAEDIMALIDEPAEPETLDQNAVLGYLTELSDEEYKKLCKVADVYRKADKDANKIMGKIVDGDKIDVRVVPKDETGFIDTADEKLKQAKGTTENANKTK